MKTLGKVTLERRGDVLVAALVGDVDLTNAPDVGAQLASSVPNSVRALVIDLSETTYLDSRGVHVLLDVMERLQIRRQTLHLVVPERSVLRRLLATLALADAVPVAATLEEAVERIQAPGR